MLHFFYWGTALLFIQDGNGRLSTTFAMLPVSLAYFTQFFDFNVLCTFHYDGFFYRKPSNVFESVYKKACDELHVSGKCRLGFEDSRRTRCHGMMERYDFLTAITIISYQSNLLFIICIY